MNSLTTIILAAGQGKRMKSALPKILHPLAGRPLLIFALELARHLKSRQTVLVVPKKYSDFQNAVLQKYGKNFTVSYAVQEPRLGTGHAVKCAFDQILTRSGTVLVLNADMPLIQPNSLKKLFQIHQKQNTAISFLSCCQENPFGSGRVRRDENGKITKIIEERDATPDEKKISEVNLGVYFFDLDFLRSAIESLKSKNNQKEYYLTDLIEIAANQNLNVQSHCLGNEWEGFGINSQQDLWDVTQVFFDWQKEKFYQKGVSLLGQDIFIEADVKIGAGTVIEAPCYLKGGTQIGRHVVIESGNVIQSSKLADRVHVKAHCYIDHSELAKDVQVGPFAHLRPETYLATGVKIGNFVELKKSKLGQGSKANHLSYIGDAFVGRHVNIGAGTITCNYDGRKKNKTVIGDGVFIGSDTQLVAPVRIGKGAYVGAGTTVTKNVAAQSLALSRVPQQEILGWARKRKKGKR